jgi:hypothetical protein
VISVVRAATHLIADGVNDKLIRVVSSAMPTLTADGGNDQDNYSNHPGLAAILISRICTASPQRKGLIHA